MTPKDFRKQEIIEQQKLKLLDDLIALNPNVPFDSDFNGGDTYYMTEDVSDQVLKNIKVPSYCKKVDQVCYASFNVKTKNGVKMRICGFDK